MWLISKRREMFNADESRSKIALVWEGTSDVRTLWSSNCCGCSGFILFTAPRKLHNLPHIHSDKEFLNKNLELLQLIGRKGRRTTTKSPRVCTSGLRKGFCGAEPEPRPELGDHVSWNKQSDCEAMAVPVNWKPCKQTRFCHKAIRRQPPVVLPLQKWKDLGLCR